MKELESPRPGTTRSCRRLRQHQLMAGSMRRHVKRGETLRQCKTIVHQYLGCVARRRRVPCRRSKVEGRKMANVEGCDP